MQDLHWQRTQRLVRGLRRENDDGVQKLLRHLMLALEDMRAKGERTRGRTHADRWTKVHAASDARVIAELRRLRTLRRKRSRSPVVSTDQ